MDPAGSNHLRTRTIYLIFVEKREFLIPLVTREEFGNQQSGYRELILLPV
jgi:hypothetical protein